MIRRYLASFFMVLVALCAAATLFPFVYKSHVRAGAAGEDTYRCEFTLHITEPVDKPFYVLEGAVKAALESGTQFVGTGAVQVVSSKVELAAQAVSYQDGGQDLVAPGAAMTAHVQWKARDAASGPGEIEILLPNLNRVELQMDHPFVYRMESGNYQVVENRHVFRQIEVHADLAGLILGRMFLASSIGLPAAVVLHSIWWLFVLHREKRRRCAALAPAGPEPLPRTFHPSPIAEWFWFTVVALILGFLGALTAVLASTDNFLSPIIFGLIILIVVFGWLLALFVAWCVRSSVVTLKIDADSVSYAKGRRTKNWIAARWADLQDAQSFSRTYNGSQYEWVVLKFPGGKKRKFSQNTVDDFPLVRDTVLALFAHHHPTLTADS